MKPITSQQILVTPAYTQNKWMTIKKNYELNLNNLRHQMNIH